MKPLLFSVPKIKLAYREHLHSRVNPVNKINIDTYTPGMAVVYQMLIELVFKRKAPIHYVYVGAAGIRTQTVASVSRRFVRHRAAVCNGDDGYEKLLEPHLLGSVTEVNLIAEILDQAPSSVIEDLETKYGQAAKARFGDLCITNHGTRRRL